MIRLEQDTINKVIVTLREFTTISNPFYLFQLTTSTEDLLNSIVKLPLKGFYKYNIYSQVSSTNLDLANITELVEVGKVYVDGTIKPDLTIYGSGTDNKIVYNG